MYVCGSYVLLCFVSLYNRHKAVFGPKLEQQPTGLGDQNGVLAIRKGTDIGENLYGDEFKCSSVQVSFCAFIS